MMSGPTPLWIGYKSFVVNTPSFNGPMERMVAEEEEEPGRESSPDEKRGLKIAVLFEKELKSDSIQVNHVQKVHAASVCIIVAR